MNRRNLPLLPAGALRAGPVPGALAARPDVMVVSHERSGTHFLINALTRAYDYPERFLDFDQSSLNINYFAPQAIASTVAEVAKRRSSAILKSHHAVDFFDGILDEVLKKTTIFYIHRDPVDVMISLWRFINHWGWREGPKRTSALEFAASQPEGQMLRYQMKQQKSMLHRWAQHVDGWTTASTGRERLVVVRFDQLKSRYEQTVADFGGLLGRRSGSLTPPSRNANVIQGAPVDRLERPDRDALRALALAEVGETMRRQGYA
jgi:Sulfotransferase domain